MRIEQGVDFEFRGQQEWGVARPSAGKRIANLGESNVRLEICLRYVHPHNTREAVACTNNARDHKAVSVRNERRKRMEGRLQVENVCRRKPHRLGRDSRERFAEAAGDELAK